MNFFLCLQIENENSKIIDTQSVHHVHDDDDDDLHHTNNQTGELNSRGTRNNESSLNDESSVSSGQPLYKKLKTEVVDAESNTTHSGKFLSPLISYDFFFSNTFFARVYKIE